MSTTISSNSNKTIAINTNIDDWHIEAGVTVNVRGHSAVFVDDGFDYNQIYNAGHIKNSGTEAAVLLAGIGNYFENVGKTATISGQSVGVELAGNQDIFINSGSIDGGKYGFLSTGSVSTVDNKGDVHGDKAALSVAGAGINFLNRGKMEGDVAYLSTDPMAGGGMLVNKGTAIGDSGIAVKGGQANDFISNFGKMIGDVMLGGGNDTFDFQHGKIKGDVQGGTGDDTFVIYTGRESFIEKAGQGSDWVSTSVDYTLKTNFENLHLNGHEAIDGTGNGANNWMEGNDNANILKGLGGKDRLDGGEGDDVLVGGGGIDTFHFELGCQADTISDFHLTGAEKDLIDLSDYEGLTGFAALKAGHMSQDGNDVLIDFGNLDTIRIQNVALDDLDASRFLF